MNLSVDGIIYMFRCVCAECSIHFYIYISQYGFITVYYFFNDLHLNRLEFSIENRVIYFVLFLWFGDDTQILYTIKTLITLVIS